MRVLKEEDGGAVTDLRGVSENYPTCVYIFVYIESARAASAGYERNQ